MVDPQNFSHMPDVSDLNAEGEMVRSEEQLHLSTISVPFERIRLRKVIVSEEQTITVTVRREELRITRQPISVHDHQPSFSRAQDTVIVLHEERLVMTRQIVPMERVSVSVKVTTDDQAVTESVRKERITVEESN